MGFMNWLRGGGTVDFHDGSIESIIISAQLQDAWKVSQDAAMGVAAIFRAREINADTLAAMPLMAGETLLPAPNRDQTMQDAVAEIVLSMEDCGDAYLRVTQDGFKVLDPAYMAVNWSQVENRANRRRVYTYESVRQRTTGITRNLVVVSMNRGAGDLTGFGPMESSAITGAIALQKYAQGYFQNNGQPTGVLTTPTSLTADEAKLLKEAWMDSRAVRSPAVLSGGMTWSGEGFSPNDSQWVESHMATIGDIANLFGVKGPMLNYNQPGSNLTYENVETIYQGYWREGLYPTYAKRIEAAIGGIYETVAKFDPSALFLPSIQDRAQAASVLGNAGFDHRQASEAVGLEPIDPQPQEVPSVPGS